MIASLRTSVRLILAICLVSLFVAGAAAARSLIPAVNTHYGLAIKGYDPVSYFTIGKATRGLPQFSVTYQRAIYRFASAEARERFISMPEKFVPQYGGYCAFAIARNSIQDINPHEWAIVNGKLYLNNNFLSQALWSFDKSGNITRGNYYWPLVPKQPTSIALR
ncbi:MAG TPA: YHS domain-containing (seleno)protein [Stellaceae bacterium]|nr:YHS domain-containing (seleno)protein [Stellaceae bacterium]